MCSCKNRNSSGVNTLRTSANVAVSGPQSGANLSSFNNDSTADASRLGTASDTQPPTVISANTVIAKIGNGIRGINITFLHP
jgi:hypothetical protein